MSEITKNKFIEGRPLFKSANSKTKYSKGSFLKKNTLFKSLDPSLCPSKIEVAFWNFKEWIRPYFSVQKPDLIKANIREVVRPKEEGITLANLWDYHKKFLDKDRECPRNVRVAFEVLAKNEKACKKLKNDKQTQALTNKIHQEILTLPEGKTRLFLFEGNQVCSITKTENAHYKIQLFGNDLDSTSIPLAGKEKTIKSLTFTDVKPALINNLLNDWVSGSDFNAEPFKPYRNESLTYENLTTRSNKADKLFWHVMMSFVPESKIHRLHLRTDLLTLFKTFRKERTNLNPSSGEYQDLKKLFEEVSAKVMVAHKKNTISDVQLAEINEKLAIIKKELEKAQIDPVKTIPSKISLSKHRIKNDVIIKVPTAVSGVMPDFQNISEKGEVPDCQIDLKGLMPFSLETYTSIDSPEAFMEGLTLAHQAPEEIFRFFSEVKLSELTVQNKKNEDSLWWQLSEEDIKRAMQMIVEITEGLVIAKKPESISQYEFESLEKMTSMMEFFSARISGSLICVKEASRDFLSTYRDNDLNDFRFYQRFDAFLKENTKDPLSQLDPSIFPRFIALSIPGAGIKVVQVGPGKIKINDLSANPGTASLFHYMDIMQTLLGDTKGYYTLFGKKHFYSLFLEDFYKKAEDNLWMKPIDNAYLVALFKEALIRNNYQDWDQRYQADGFRNNIKPSDPLTAKAPEAFHSNPEGAVDYFLQELKKKNPKLPSSSHLSPDVIKSLSRLLRTDSPHEELIAFMHESPHLLMNPEIRNFFDALFFGPSLLLLGENKENLTEIITIYPKQIKEAISQFLVDLAGTEKLPLLLYYIEMYVKLNEVFVMKGLPLDEFNFNIEGLLAILFEFEDPEITGYAARLLLRTQLAAQEINGANGSAILTSFADVFGSSIDRMNKDPYFEEKISRDWAVISKNLKDSDLEPLIERFFYRKNIALDGSPWNPMGDLVFQNDQYVIDLKTWKISRVGTKDTVGYLPGEIQASRYIKAALPLENLSQIQAVIQEIEDRLVYSFKDSEGNAFQIEKDKTLRLYRKMPSSTWLEFIPPTLEKSNDILTLLKKPKTPPALFKEGIYVDPKHRKKGFILSKKGTVDFEVALTHKKGSITVQSVTDCRADEKSGPWKVNSLSSAKGLNLLNHFEDPGSVVLWSKQGHLKKVELPRYGITFALENGRLKCLSEPMEGYFIDPNASIKDKKGYQFALLLEHPDPTRPKKLLLPDAKTLVNTKEMLLPKAKGFAKIGLLNEFRKNLLKGKMPEMVFKNKIKLTAGQDGLNYTAIDIRSETGELIKKRKEWPEAVFALIQQAAITERPILAHSWYQKFPFDEAITNHDLLEKMVQYCQNSSNSGSESALKCKLSLKLFNTLKENKKLNTSLKATLQGIILETGKQQFAEGRRVPGVLSLTAQEMLQLAKIAKKNDSKYFDEHLAVYFLKKGESFDFVNPVDADRLHFPVKEVLPIKDIDLTPLAANQLTTVLPLTVDKIPLLFTKDEVEKLFSMQAVEIPELKIKKAGSHPYEKVALEEFQNDLATYRKKVAGEVPLLKANKKSLDRFMRTKIVPKQIAHEEEMARAKLEIQSIQIQNFSEEDKTAFYAGRKKIPSFDELRLSLIQDTIAPDLKIPLIAYFDAFSRKNAADSAMALLRDIQSKKRMDPKTKELLSNALYKLLTLERNYNPEVEVRLLIFEAQTFKNFRPLDGGLHQLDLLESLINNPYSIVQAPTGAGKTSVLSVMSSLLKANGKNLVVQKVLPPLYEQTHEQLHDVLEGVFETLVMPFRFNLKMRLTTKETYFENKEQKTREVSVFKGMFESLALVIENKGCVLTDYTSLPLLEEKFFKLGQELYEQIAPSAIDREHYDYLRKILLLLESKAVVNQDEFDGPNRPIQKLQLAFGPGSDLPKFLADTTQEIYAILAEDKTLALKQNIQGDITEEMRALSIEKAAKAMAVKLGHPELVDYFLGKNDDGLDLINDPDLLDQLALCKDQFSIYLPLTLSYNQGSRYARTLDGSRTVPCKSGERRDAKFGTILEQMNYTIQDYLQSGITAYDLTTWLQEFGEDFKDHKATQDEFMPLFTPYTVEETLTMLKTPAGTATLIEHINQGEHVSVFLDLRLKKIKTSGALISMDPGNIVDMNRADSGISATTGAKESLHSKFEVDAITNGHVRAEMAYRIFKRAEGVIAYDPANPKEMLDQLDDVSVIIDGADAYKNHPKQAADDLIAHNSGLIGVEYKDENDKSRFAGKPTNKLSQKGYVFKESNTVGTDIKLAEDAKAVLTLNEKHGMRDYAQKEGRLRLPGQTCTLALSQYLNVDTLEEAMGHAITVDAGVDAKDIYRHCKQELHGIVRQEMKKKLLACESVEDFLEIYNDKECRRLFITPPEATFQEPGSYFAARKTIEKADTKPENALEALKKRCRTQAEGLGLDNAIVRLDEINYSLELLNKMLPLVSDSQAELEMELQMEEELEKEMEQERELQVETQVQVEDIQAALRTDVLYPRRLESDRKHLVRDKIHPAYFEGLYVSDNFLPFSRDKTDSLFKRRPFDSSMYRIGEVIITPNPDGTVHITIDDPIKDGTMRNNANLVYDIRTNKITAYNKLKWKQPPSVNNKNRMEEFAQIKFLDGRTDGYLPQEVECLKEWFAKEGVDRMKDHLQKDILRYRYRDQLRFKGSQLEEIFNSLN